MSKTVVHQLVESPCPVCGLVEERFTYAIGSGPELSCSNCEWCWGAEGQSLAPITLQRVYDSMPPEGKEVLEPFIDLPVVKVFPESEPDVADLVEEDSGDGDVTDPAEGSGLDVGGEDELPMDHD